MIGVCLGVVVPQFSREFSIATTSASLLASLAPEIVRVSPGAGMNGSATVRRPPFISVGYELVDNDD